MTVTAGIEGYRIPVAGGGGGIVGMAVGVGTDMSGSTVATGEVCHFYERHIDGAVDVLDIRTVVYRLTVRCHRIRVAPIA